MSTMPLSTFSSDSPLTGKRQPTTLYLRRLAVLLLFTAGFLVLYFFSVWQITFSSTKLIPKLKPGKSSTIRRFAEAETSGPVDIVFIGSSHTYRSFDPRIFKSAGKSSFNLGSTSQSTVESYYILRDFLPRLKPGLVVMELYPLLLSLDKPVESFMDLAANRPLSLNLVYNALATRNVTALNFLVSTSFRKTRYALSRYNFKPEKDETYISGGYVETKSDLTGKTIRPVPYKIRPLSQHQLDYLACIIDDVRSRNSKIVFTSAPTPRAHQARTLNYKQVIETLRRFLKKHRVAYLEFNHLALDEKKHYFDDDHLNQAGVQIFNGALVRELKTIW